MCCAWNAWELHSISSIILPFAFLSTREVLVFLYPASLFSPLSISIICIYLEIQSCNPYFLVPSRKSASGTGVDTMLSSFPTHLRIFAGICFALLEAFVQAEVHFVGFDASHVVDVGTSVTLSWEGNVSVSCLAHLIRNSIVRRAGSHSWQACLCKTHISCANLGPEEISRIASDADCSAL